MNFKLQRKIVIFTFLALPLLQLLIFTYYAAATLIQLSLTDWNGYSTQLKYVGLQNYIDAVKDYEVWIALRNNTAYIFTSIVQTLLALYFAVILNGQIKARNFFRGTIFMPYIMNGVAVAFMFGYFYNFDNGPINMLLDAVGLGAYKVHFFGNGYVSNFALSFMGMWKYTGSTMVLFLGALQSIPNELYEAAEIDGAKYWHKVRYIIIPNIINILGLNLFLSINGGLQAFNEPYVLFQGNPPDEVSTFLTKTLSIGFRFQNFGKASALAVMLLIIVLIVLYAQRKVFKESED